MDLLNNTNTILGIVASCVTIIAVVIPILVHSRKSAPSSASQKEQLQPSSSVSAAEPVPFTSRLLAAILGLIIGMIICAIVFILLSLFVNFILNLIIGNSKIYPFPHWFTILLFIFVFLLPTLVGIFSAIFVGKRFLDMSKRRLEWEESRRIRNLEWEESVRRDQARMEEFRNRFNFPRNSNENRPDRWE